MKTSIIAIGLLLSFLQGHLFANIKDVNRSIRTQEESTYDCARFSALYASRGEDYLILGDDQKALEDFLRSYEYALKSGDEIEEAIIWCFSCLYSSRRFRVG